MSRFSVGDRVVVLSGINSEDYTSGWYEAGMSKYVGHEFTIKSVHSGHACTLTDTSGDYGDVYMYTFDDRYLELSVDDIKEFDEEDFGCRLQEMFV